MKSLRTLAIVSAIYDFAIGLPLLLAPVHMASLFGAPAPSPVINAQLNGLFTVTLALGYLWAVRDVENRRGYLWIAGVFAKLLGAILFVADHLVNHSPPTFLLFAVTDGSLSVWSLILLGKTSTR